jgi:hypothetical protein
VHFQALQLRKTNRKTQKNKDQSGFTAFASGEMALKPAPSAAAHSTGFKPLVADHL